MPPEAPTSPVEDSVPKVDNKISIGEDLNFQRKWWRFERAIWLFFLIILIADVLGAFGRGWLANAHRIDSAHTLTLDYERILRANTPSIMTLHFTPAAIHNGKIQVFVSESVIRPLGAQRIAPQPAVSTLGNNGITYTFDATAPPAIVEISLLSSFPGRHHIRIQAIAGQPIDANVFVVP